MPAYYFDTSALVKRYIAEAGSTWVRQASDPVSRNVLYTSRLTGLELTAAVVRRARGAHVPAADLQSTSCPFAVTGRPSTGWWRLPRRSSITL